MIRLIRQSGKMVFEPATINTRNGPKMVAQVRNNSRIVFDDMQLAHTLWNRVGLILPEVWQGLELCGLNERFRFYRYQPKQYFNWHYDLPYERANGEKSLLTLLIYLSDGYKGGQTTFDVSDEKIDVEGSIGDVLYFPHGLRHRGSEVTQGAKYVLRTDVMYHPLVRCGSTPFTALAELKSLNQIQG